MKQYRSWSLTKDLIQKCSSCTFSWPLEPSCCFFLLSVFYPHAKEVRNMPIRKLLRQEQQMTTSIMNGFHAQPFTILQVVIRPARVNEREIVTLDLIPNKHTSSHMKTSKTRFYNCRKNNCIHQPKCLDKLHCTKYPSYQREFQYQTYSNDGEKKSNQTHQNIHTIYNVTNHYLSFGLIIKLNFQMDRYRTKASIGKRKKEIASSKTTFNMLKRNRIIKNHFQ